MPSLDQNEQCIFIYILLLLYSHHVLIIWLCLYFYLLYKLKKKVVLRFQNVRYFVFHLSKKASKLLRTALKDGTN